MAKTGGPREATEGATKRVDVLRRTPPFSALPTEHLHALARAARELLLSKDEPLWRRGQPALHLAVVLAGRVKLCRGQRTKEVIVDVGGPGDVLGEVAFSMNASYQSDVICLRRARVLLIPAQALRSLLEEQPRAALSLAMDLAAQNVRLLRVVEDLSSGSVEQRLARVLLRLGDSVGEPFPGGTLIPLRLRRADLAAIAATTLESASRKISDWHRKGWVIPQPAGYLLRDVAALRSLVEVA